MPAIKANDHARMSSTWADSYRKMKESGEELSHPSETLIRLIKGNYINGNLIDYKGKSILDVGFGNGNNTAFLSSIGMDTHGVEIDDKIIEQVSASLTAAGLKATLKKGTNRSLPYPDNSFDFLVSWNALHYEGTEEYIIEAIKEFRRVLKPGGRILISTTGPEHKILLNGKTLGNHQYEIGRLGDDRVGQIHFFFDAKNYIELYFGPHFKELQIGRIYDDMFFEKLDWWLITGVK